MRASINYTPAATSHNVSERGPAAATPQDAVADSPQPLRYRWSFIALLIVLATGVALGYGIGECVATSLVP